MCYVVKNCPNISDKKRFKSPKGAQKAVTDAMMINPAIDLTKVEVIDSHTGKSVSM